MTALEQRLDRAHVLGFDDTYLDVDATCGPTVYVWYRSPEGATKLIEHYLGDASAPDGLGSIETAIDDAVGIDHWIAKPPRHSGPAAAYGR